MAPARVNLTNGNGPLFSKYKRFSVAVMNHISNAGDRHRNQTYLPGTGDTVMTYKRFPQSEAFPLHVGLADYFQYYTLPSGTHMFSKTSFSSFF